MYRSLSLVALAAFLVGGCGGGDDGDPSLDVKWAFDSGDCAGNNVQTVRITWSKVGDTSKTVEFACTDGGGRLGSPGAGDFAINAEGFDANGVARVSSYPVTVSRSGSGTVSIPIDLTLHAAPADVIVTWTLSDGARCPGSVILPYFITLYEAPSVAGAGHGASVDELQESCSTGKVTFTDVAAGSYVVELDSRAVTPTVKASREITVISGEDLQVDIRF